MSLKALVKLEAAETLSSPAKAEAAMLKSKARLMKRRSKVVSIIAWFRPELAGPESVIYTGI